MEELLTYATSYEATLRKLRKEKGMPWKDAQALFVENLARVKAAIRFYKHLRRAQLKARTEAHFQAHRANLACHRIAMETILNRHHEATAYLLTLPQLLNQLA
jgi:hypothetical protein